MVNRTPARPRAWASRRRVLSRLGVETLENRSLLNGTSLLPPGILPLPAPEANEVQVSQPVPATPAIPAALPAETQAVSASVPCNVPTPAGPVAATVTASATTSVASVTAHASLPAPNQLEPTRSPAPIE